MHSPDATWETTLVIPETAKPIDVQTLDALLRVEKTLEALRVDFLRTRRDQIIEEKAEEKAAPKGKRK
jgi:hypothetical protein